MDQKTVLWEPSKAFLKKANLTRYTKWLKKEYSLDFPDYKTLWEWSVKEPEAFWKSIAAFYQVKFHEPPREIISAEGMPHTKWFEGATLNYAEHIFRNKTEQRPAILFATEKEPVRRVSWKELTQQTAALQEYLRGCGVKPGDRVAAYIPNIPQATISFLATTALGAVWSSCSPDFGAKSVLDRFKQISPKVLIAVDGYKYNGKSYDRTEILKEISEQLPSLEKVIFIPYLDPDPDNRGETIKNVAFWPEIIAHKSAKLTFEPVPFSHPIWILYSSGTTGAPKAITHSHGGVLLEHLKYLSLHNDVHPGENFFWYSTTGWMMWNFVQAALLVGASIVLYDGSAGYAKMRVLWRLAEELPIHHFGTSAPFILACRKAGLKPGEEFDLSALRSIGSTGSPLPPEGFDYAYEEIKSDLWLCSMSGGTDICTAWVGGNPWKPILEGEIQSRALGCSMYAYDERGEAVTDEVGEMVVTRPMPSMPIFFWGDKDFKRYTESYFEMFPGKWRHGDWVEITSHGGVIIYGRSDTTLNRQGVRIGTAEVYRAIDRIDEIKDSLIVNIEQPNGGSFMPLFVLMKKGLELNKEIKTKIKAEIRKAFSPRHVPDRIIAVPDIPYTISGKKMEAPVKKILMGRAVKEAVNKGAMRNPESVDFFVGYVQKMK